MALKFIDVTTGSRQDRARVARRHAADLNRQRKSLLHKQRAEAQRAVQRSGSTTSSPGFDSDAGLSLNVSNQSTNFSTPELEYIDEQQRLEQVEAVLSTDHVDGWRHELQKRNGYSRSTRRGLSDLRQIPQNPLIHDFDSTSWLPASLTPAGLPSAYPTNASYGMTWMPECFLMELLPNLLGGHSDALAAWSMAFINEPILYHAMHWVAAVHTDSLTNKAHWTTHTGVLIHLAKSLSMLRQQVASSQAANPELTLLVVLCLTKCDLQPSDIEKHWMSLFTPHVPMANWASLGAIAQHVEVQLQAVKDILCCIGGIDKLTTPGLAEVTAFVDLTAASTMCRKPRLPNIWPANSTGLSFSTALRLPSMSGSGQGFIYKVPQGFPEVATSVFAGLSTINSTMNIKRQQFSDADEGQALLRARNGMHHALLSLPSWDELDDDSKRDTHSVAYEACRLSCIIYSNAILMGFSYNTGWHETHVKRLRILLALFDGHAQAEDMLELLTWVLFVGGIAAYQLPEFPFFVKLLRKTMIQRGITSLADVRKGLEDFIWSDNACLAGATVLWEAVESSNSDRKFP